MALNLGTLFLHVSVTGHSQVTRMDRSLSGLTGTAKGATTALAALAGLQAANKIRKDADSYIEFKNSIRLATDSQEEMNTVMGSLIEISRKTATELETTGLLYRRMEMATNRLGISQERLMGITETVTKATALGGSTAQEAAGALRQFSQALSGDFKASGQEINSVLEQTPGLANAIADGLRTTTDQLKIMVNEQQLSAEQVIQAIEKQADAVDKAYKKINFTSEKGLTKLNIAFTALVGEVDDAVKATETFEAAMDDLSKTMISDDFVNGTKQVALLAKEMLSLAATIPKFAASGGVGGALYRAILGDTIKGEVPSPATVPELAEIGRTSTSSTPGKAPASLGGSSAAPAPLFSQSRMPVDPATFEAMQKLTDSTIDFGEAAEGSMEAVFGMSGSFADAAEEMNTLHESVQADKFAQEIKEMEKATQQLSATLEQTLGTELKNLMTGNFDDIGSAFESMIQNMISQAIAADIMSYFGMGGSGNGTAQLAGAFMGMFGGGYAKGGNPPIGKASIVGENGPELLVPRGASTVIPNDQIGGNGGSTTQIFNIQTRDAESFRSSKSKVASSMRGLTRR